MSDVFFDVLMALHTVIRLNAAKISTIIITALHVYECFSAYVCGSMAMAMAMAMAMEMAMTIGDWRCFKAAVIQTRVCAHLEKNSDDDCIDQMDQSGVEDGERRSESRWYSSHGPVIPTLLWIPSELQ